MADGQTPVGLYRALAADRPGTFLLESAEHDGTWGRYSFIGVASAAMLTERSGRARWVGNVPVGLPAGGNPLDALRDSVAALHTRPLPGLPPLTSGMVGLIGYDAVRRWEAIPDSNPDELGLPELAMMLVADLAVFDAADNTVWLIANAINFDAGPERVGRGLRGRRGAAGPDVAAAGRAGRPPPGRAGRRGHGPSPGGT